MAAVIKPLLEESYESQEDTGTREEAGETGQETEIATTDQEEDEKLELEGAKEEPTAFDRAKEKVRKRLEGTEDVPVESVEGGLFDGSDGATDLFTDEDGFPIEEPAVEYAQGVDSLNRSQEIYGDVLTQVTEQVNVLEIARKLNAEAVEAWGGWMAYTDKNLPIIIENMFAEVLAAYEANPNATGWYKKSLVEAMAYASTKYPELANDSDVQQAFKFIMAITSNGQRVVLNSTLTDQLYAEYRKTRTFNFDAIASLLRPSIDPLSLSGSDVYQWYPYPP